MSKTSLWSDIRNLPEDTVKRLSFRVEPTFVTRRPQPIRIKVSNPDRTSPNHNRERVSGSGNDKVTTRVSRLAREIAMRHNSRLAADKRIAEKLNPKGLTKKQKRRAFRSPA